jgi:hypothetical protein
MSAREADVQARSLDQAEASRTNTTETLLIPYLTNREQIPEVQYAQDFCKFHLVRASPQRF